VDRKYLLERLNNKSRELSTRTVIFHQWIGESLGLNTVDHKCLDIILRSNKLLTGIELAKETGLTSGAITGVIDRLEKAGYVQRKRDDNDRRLVFIEPFKEKAEADFGPLFSVLQEKMDKLYSNYKDEDLAIISDFMSKSIEIMIEATENIRNKSKDKDSNFKLQNTASSSLQTSVN
jgi:DNA-binding MarR family transcriptional regulator